MSEVIEQADAQEKQKRSGKKAVPNVKHAQYAAIKLRGPKKKAETFEIIEPPPEVTEQTKRKRGPNKKPSVTADPDYYKNYYLNKTKPNLHSEDSVIRCERCDATLFRYNLGRHMRTLKCQLVAQALRCRASQPYTPCD
jgi:hypothetical protein